MSAALTTALAAATPAALALMTGTLLLAEGIRAVRRDAREETP